MMEEVADMMAYDAHVMENMSEEEILACLVVESGPEFTDPAKENNQGESRLQIMEDEEDPLDKYLKENRRLQQASIRLEQENDNLAHRLIIGKVDLRHALDKAEDRVDELARDLMHTRLQLRDTEEEKTLKEQETATLKEMFRSELQKAEQEVRRSSGIIVDYKQICSQLTERLERQQAAHREELDSIASAVQACSQCRHIAELDKKSSETEGHGTSQPGQDKEDNREQARVAERRKDDREKESLRAQIKELEQDLVQTKLQMVEAKCKIQELEHQKGLLANDLQEAKNSWISKAVTSLRASSSSSSRAGGGGLHGLRMPRDRWSTKKLYWPHRDEHRKTSDGSDCELDTT